MKNQITILNDAPKFRYYYAGGQQEKYIIPDTLKAGKWAIENGATHFDALSFCRFEKREIPATYRWGDFHCHLTDMGKNRTDDIMRSQRVLSNFLCEHMRMFDHTLVKLTPLGVRQMALTIPDFFFRMENGSEILLEYYEAIANELRNWPEIRSEMIVIHHDGRIGVESIPRGIDGSPILPMRGKFASASGGSRHQATVSPHSIPFDAPGARIDPEIDADLKRMALRRQNAHYKTRRVSRKEWPALKPLYDATTGALTCGLEHSESAVKCAISLKAWFIRAEVGEFRRQNALKAVDGSFTLKGGVLDALQILVAHGYIRECPLIPAIGYSGQRPVWFVVNPAVFRA